MSDNLIERHMPSSSSTTSNNHGASQKTTSTWSTAASSSQASLTGQLTLRNVTGKRRAFHPISLLSTCKASVVKAKRRNYSHMKPGGYVEAQEVLPVPKTDDDSFPPDSAMQEWARVIYEGTAKLGLNIRVPSTQIKTWMEQAGFEDVTVVDFKLPLGPWSKEKHLREAGNAEAMSLRDNLQGVTLRLWEKGLGRSYEELEVFLVKVRKEFDDKSIHAYFPLWVSLPPPCPAEVRGCLLIDRAAMYFTGGSRRRRSRLRARHMSIRHLRSRYLRTRLL